MPKTSDDGTMWLQAGITQTAIFLWQGFMHALGLAPFTNNKNAKDQELYDFHFDGLGQDGGALSMGVVARVVEQRFEDHWAKYNDFPGVYHYDIIEPLGIWWAKEGPQLSAFQYTKKERDAALASVIEHYDELMAAWLVTDKLTTHAS